jgi:predicted site-specific integrase-resolvase
MGEAEKTPRRSTKKIRCAIYTRKSTEEGLEQAFNSLDAQREACAAFIASQRHEGWMASPTLYDDGGFSGGTIQRPALQRLMTDIEATQIDVVVVYKVDRLTRALSDFARLVEVFDRRGVSFVSITQQFNTTTSMGRLTLNVLLSFAQFEREGGRGVVRATTSSGGLFLARGRSPVDPNPRPYPRPCSWPRPLSGCGLGLGLVVCQVKRIPALAAILNHPPLPDFSRRSVFRFREAVWSL